MPVISKFFGIVIRLFYDEHNPPHLHAEYQRKRAVFDFQGNIIRGGLTSKTAVKLIREWIDLHSAELENDWKLAKAGKQIKEIDPLT